MNIKALRAFRLVVSEGSVNAAAKALCLSQPAVSRLIALLESELKLTLFLRDGRRMVLTEQGAAFLQEAARPAERPALGEFAERLMDIGDGWRAFALAAARMVKGRDPFDPPALAEHLFALAVAEKGFFTELKAAVS